MSQAQPSETIPGSKKEILLQTVRDLVQKESSNGIDAITRLISRKVLEVGNRQESDTVLALVEKRAEELGFKDATIDGIIDALRTFYSAIKGTEAKNEKQVEINQPQTIEDLSHLIENLSGLLESTDCHLSDSQKRVITSIIEVLAKEKKSCYVGLATGFGKTNIYLEIAKCSKKPVLILTTGCDLVDQAEKSAEKHVPGLKIGKVYGGTKNHREHTTIMTYASFVSQVADGTLDPKKFGLVIADECHLALTDKRKEALKKCTNAALIGFTATPFVSTRRQCKDFFGDEAHRIKLREAVTVHKTAAPIKVIFAKTEVDLSQVGVTAGRFRHGELERTINLTARNKAAVLLYIEEYLGKKGIAFCGGVDHAKKLADEFNARFLENGLSLRAASITGEDSPTKRRDTIRDFKEGSIHILTGDEIPKLGLDDPTVEVGFNMVPTGSPVVAEQRIGRIARKDPKNPHKLATIIEFLDRIGSARVRVISAAEIIGGATLHVESPALPTSPSASRKPSPNIIKKPPTGGISLPNDLGVTVYVDDESVMSLANEIQASHFEHPPEGWKTAEEICIELNIDPIYADPIYFGLCRNPLGKKDNTKGLFQDKHTLELKQYFSPNMAALALNRKNLMPSLKPPAEMSATYKIDEETVFNIIKKALANPESKSSFASIVRELKAEYGNLQTPETNTEDYIYIRDLVDEIMETYLVERIGEDEDDGDVGERGDDGFGEEEEDKEDGEDEEENIKKKERRARVKRNLTDYLVLQASILAKKDTTASFFNVGRNGYYLHQNKVAEVKASVAAFKKTDEFEKFHISKVQNSPEMQSLKLMQLTSSSGKEEFIRSHPDQIRFNLISGTTEINTAKFFAWRFRPGHSRQFVEIPPLNSSPSSKATARVVEALHQGSRGVVQINETTSRGWMDKTTFMNLQTTLGELSPPADWITIEMPGFRNHESVPYLFAELQPPDAVPGKRTQQKYYLNLEGYREAHYSLDQICDLSQKLVAERARADVVNIHIGTETGEVNEHDLDSDTEEIFDDFGEILDELKDFWQKNPSQFEKKIADAISGIRRAKDVEELIEAMENCLNFIKESRNTPRRFQGARNENLLYHLESMKKQQKNSFESLKPAILKMLKSGKT